MQWVTGNIYYSLNSGTFDRTVDECAMLNLTLDNIDVLQSLYFLIVLSFKLFSVPLFGRTSSALSELLLNQVFKTEPQWVGSEHYSNSQAVCFKWKMQSVNCTLVKL